MAILKCKICGGDMTVSADKTFGICEYCGSTMTLPKIDDDQRAEAFNRGNHFRRIGEFDKALSVYERIVEESPDDAEAHWCCALCRFGIEWVEDPATMEYLPTCHRASFDIFTSDVDYLAAVELSEGLTKKQYIRDGAKISEVQKGILATSQNEEPFDVFICYKETDENGNRTVDSTLAQDIYYQLTDQGMRVFFARITLEDKVGSEYEPYIFAALNSAKVMVAVGTDPKNFNAVWVKNEWSRFLSIVKHDRSKVLLPCYKDMDPYDLPEQLSVLQSYDMSKIGFIQDLIRGITKVIKANEPKTEVKETVAGGAGNVNVAPLLERVSLFLEDGKWKDADIYCEKVLDIDPKNAEAYLGKLMAELKVNIRKQLADCAESFEDRENYGKIIRFGDDKLEAEIRGYLAHINERNENERLTGIYNDAVSTMNAASTEYAFKVAGVAFKSIPGFKDADELAEQCFEKAEDARKIEEEEAQGKNSKETLIFDIVIIVAVVLLLIILFIR
ncbi:MAG: TIR domain-containing protein [Clostridia bacterium]|nr:TIR domain-containing protein [Clostridia bacterium]